MPFSAGLRQRTFFRIWDLQRHGLDRPHARAHSEPQPRPAGIAFAQFPKKEVYIGPGKLPAEALEQVRNADLEPSQASHKFRLDKQTPHVLEGGEERIVSSREFPIQTTLTAVRMDLQPARCAKCIGILTPTSGSIT